MELQTDVYALTREVAALVGFFDFARSRIHYGRGNIN